MDLIYVLRDRLGTRLVKLTCPHVPIWDEEYDAWVYYGEGTIRIDDTPGTPHCSGLRFPELNTHRRLIEE